MARPCRAVRLRVLACGALARVKPGPVPRPVALSRCAGLASPLRAGPYKARTPPWSRRRTVMAKTIYVLNGPNLNLLGTREPETYGRATLEDVETLCREAGKTARARDRISPVEPRGRNRRLDPRGRRQEGRRHRHQSRAPIPTPRLRSATRSRRSNVPVVEVHISNVFARERFRHHSHIAPVAKASLCGFGIGGYALAIDGLAALIDTQAKGLKPWPASARTRTRPRTSPRSITT